MRWPMMVLCLLAALALPACTSFRSDFCPPELIDQGGQGPPTEDHPRAAVAEGLAWLALGVLEVIARAAASAGCHCHCR